VGKKFDDLVIPKLWEENLIHGAEKIWQSGKDSADQAIPVVRFIVRFFPGSFGKVAEAIIRYIIEEKYAIL
jgi:hypothetical protein